jgi:hypothetical protein
VIYLLLTLEEALEETLGILFLLFSNSSFFSSGITLNIILEKREVIKWKTIYCYKFFSVHSLETLKNSSYIA